MANLEGAIVDSDFFYYLYFLFTCYLSLAGEQSIAIRMSVCLSVTSHISNFTNFSAHVTVAVARSSSDDSRISYVLPVLLMTSCFHIMVHMQWLGGSRHSTYAH